VLSFAYVDDFYPVKHTSVRSEHDKGRLNSISFLDECRRRPENAIGIKRKTEFSSTFL